MTLLKNLETKGRLLYNEPLSRHTTFRIGGPVDVWVEPKRPEDLMNFLEAAKSAKLPVMIIGEGSNLLVSDKGLKAMAIHLGDALGAGMGLQGFIIKMIEKGFLGLEFMAGIPGTVGGAIKMNAGAGLKGPWISDFISRLRVCDYSGRARWVEKKDMKSGYRDSGLKDVIILEAEFNLKKEKHKKEDARKEYQRFLDEKKNRQDLSRPSAGCIFKNPKEHGSTAAQLIEGCGLKSQRIGGAVISEKHANFIVNSGNATFNDVIELIGLIKDTVFNRYGVKLETEIEIIGENKGL
jgi:UDP-N-acetylmuramate dehydrogenase